MVVAWLTDGEGDITLELVVEDAESLEELSGREIPFRFAEPLQQLRLLVRLKAFVFPAPGTYRVTLLADGEIIAQRKFNISSKEDSHE